MPTRLDRYEDAVRGTPIEVSSPDGWVTVRRDTAGEISVSLKDGALAALREEDLAVALRETMTSAYHEYRDECRRLRRQIFGADFDQIHARGEQWPD